MSSQSTTGIPVMDPRGETPAASISMAPRDPGLDGKTIALVDNTKINAGNLLDKLSALIAGGVEPARIVRELIRQISQQCDAAVLAIGD